MCLVSGLVSGLVWCWVAGSGLVCDVWSGITFDCDCDPSCDSDDGSDGGHGWAHVYELDFDFQFLGCSDVSSMTLALSSLDAWRPFRKNDMEN